MRREGNDVTIVAWGAMVQKSLETARVLDKEGVSVEVIDLRTLVPMDMESVLRSIAKTSKVLIAHEDTLTGGFGGEVAARIAAEGFELLDAPVRRLAAKDCHIPYSWALESEILPQDKDIIQAVRDLVAY